MEMVGFCGETQRRVFAVLSAVLHIGNVEFQPKKSTYHHDESVTVKNAPVVATIADLLRVREEVLHQALVSKRARASGETLVINYRMPEVSRLALPFTWGSLYKIGFFRVGRRSPRETPWPSACTARCSTGS